MEESPNSAEQRRGPSRAQPAALVLITVLGMIFGWWAWKEGAYFGVVLLPATVLLCITTALVAVLAPRRLDFRRNRAAAIALASLTGLGLWSLLSATWSPAPDIAVGDGQRILVYALIFGLGLWSCRLLGPRMELSLVAVVGAAGFAGIITLVALLTNESARALLEIDGTLDFPLGYRNATAAFFAITLFPALGVAAKREFDPRLRAASLGTATLNISLILLCQSRGSMPALALAVLVYLLLSPFRLRALTWLVLAALPAIGTVPALTELYTTVNNEGLREAVDAMRFAGTSAALCTAVAVVIGAIAILLETRLPDRSSSTRRSNRLVAGGLAVFMAAGMIGFVLAVGDPVDWVGQRVDEVRAGGSGPSSEKSTRFGFDATSNRYDLWRVALDDFAEEPLLGDGGGGYQYTYLQKREVDSRRAARDAHSVELEVLAELGIPGLVLLLTALAATAVAIMRARKLEPSAAGLGAVALASGVYWLVHTSIDWFWGYPAVTAPALMLLGAASAPGLLVLGHAPKRGWRPLLLVALALLAVSAVPPFLSERYVNDAYANWRQDIDRAYDDLDRAGDLNPLSDAPLLAEAAIAQIVNDRERALAALRDATALRPQEYAGHYLLAELQAQQDPGFARSEILIALELNPLDEQVQALAADLGVDPENE